ncbi:DUF4430 domain-containing protein [Cellulosimicrobium cellulans]|uniref:DUF4430 domain-containing protein n=1 Tax=Cellulosimicrobium cellulans TaxID=1710 RepID=UPI001963054C|nr:DUF4430 domain-containing protein [Cellulosimicrobium cellulans]MBN0039584.1 DUF4430 domain-containing protein [Cellulosimicrobium cellulans]
MTLRTFRGTPARPLTALTAVLLAAGLLAGCSSTDEPATDATSSTSTASEETSAPADDATDEASDESGDAEDAPEFSYEGRTGTTALDLLLEADPSAQVTGEGENAFVTAIDGVAADPDSEFWALYVNGEMATVGAGSLETKDGDEITWKLETFTS